MLDIKFQIIPICPWHYKVYTIIFVLIHNKIINENVNI